MQSHMLPVVNRSGSNGPGLAQISPKGASSGSTSSLHSNPTYSGRFRQLPEISASPSMGSGRSTPCCSITTEDVKQGQGQSHRENSSGTLNGESPRQSLASGQQPPKGGSTVKAGSASSNGNSFSNPQGGMSARSNGVQSPKSSVIMVDTPEPSASAPVGSRAASSSDAAQKAGPASPVSGGPMGSIAQRRGFQPSSTKAGAPLSINTKKDKKKERRRIKLVDSAMEYYKIGQSVMPSSHSGMSIVFAERIEDGLEVVIKVRAKSNSFCDRAEEKEWRSSTEFMLNLPETDGIAKLYEVLEDKRGYYVVMEKVNGQDLFETMTGKGLLPVGEVKEVLRQLLQALAELHARNCIHKDLKLENIMFDRTPPANAKADWSHFEAGKTSPVQVKLIDFDTVEAVQPQTPKKAKDVLGTDQYIAQEAYDGNYSAASDIFAAGVIGYRLLTSKFPFKSDIFDDEAGDNWVGSPKMKEIRAKLCNYKIDWSHRVFTLEPNARELLKAMLAVNETHRPSAKEALSHAWLTTQGRRKSMPNLEAAMGSGGGIMPGGRSSLVLPNCVNQAAADARDQMARQHSP
eukprot:gb/GFBE01016017.1/.p1 GENE.gb/GFBE01016017.1/~~gb/GFBE01016017.1/.p1  ORF type:complete len:574 (+),score=108.05 gb/GFBE01016017.1/:1-1722(+)